MDQQDGVFLFKEDCMTESNNFISSVPLLAVNDSFETRSTQFQGNQDVIVSASDGRKRLANRKHKSNECQTRQHARRAGGRASGVLSINRQASQIITVRSRVLS